jgi:hypothetical protein
MGSLPRVPRAPSAMVSDLVMRGFSDTALAAAVHMGVPPSAVHTHRVEEQRNGEGGCGPVVCLEGGVAGAALAFEQRVDVGVPAEVVPAVPHFPLEALEDEVSGQTWRSLGEDCHVGLSDVESTGSAGHKNHVHLRSLVALGGLQELEE